MAEHDFYKLLGLPLGADFQEVRKAYFELSKKYHPDKNPGDPNAEDFYKVITSGYNILSNPTKKAVYDRLLAQIYQKAEQEQLQQQQVPHRDPKYRRFAVKRKTPEQRLAELSDIARSFPLTIRYVISALLILWAVIMANNHWFANELQPDQVYVLASAGMLMIALYISTNAFYIDMSIRSILGRISGKPDHLATWFFGAVAVLIPVLFISYNSWKRGYLLEHYADEATPVTVGHESGRLVYTYSAGGELFKKSLWENSQIVSDIPITRHMYLVRYARSNPSTSELYLVMYGNRIKIR